MPHLPQWGARPRIEIGALSPFQGPSMPWSWSPKPKHAILTPRIPYIYVPGEVGFLSFFHFHCLHGSSWGHPLKIGPMACAVQVGRGQFPLGEWEANSSGEMFFRLVIIISVPNCTRSQGFFPAQVLAATCPVRMFWGWFWHKISFYPDIPPSPRNQRWFLRFINFPLRNKMEFGIKK